MVSALSPGTSPWLAIPNVYPEAPQSWAELWQPEHKDRLGLLALASNSFLLEITAKTFFGDTDVLDHDEGVIKTLDKISELKPNVKLWYRDEGQFQQALQTGEIPMGQYYHDVAGLAAAGWFSDTLHIPQRRRSQRFRLLGSESSIQKTGSGACVHRLYVAARDTGQAGS